MTDYVIWSNKQNAWWGIGGGNYTQDIWEAGRWPLDEAEKLCRVRTWEPCKPPPEVAVKAPETDLALSTFEEIEAAPVFTRRLVDDVTRVAMRDRKVATR